MKCNNCQNPLPTNDINEICSNCKEVLSNMQNKTYEEGYSDGLDVGQKLFEAIYDIVFDRLQSTPPRYIVVTQEQYDKILEKSKTGGEKE